MVKVDVAHLNLRTRLAPFLCLERAHMRGREAGENSMQMQEQVLSLWETGVGCRWMTSDIAAWSGAVLPT